jgi:CubicO group peptidase (beta-lactamase class C family)
MIRNASVLGLGLMAAMVSLLFGCGHPAPTHANDDGGMVGRIENGLPSRTAMGLLLGRHETLADRMAFYRVPGVSIAVIDEFEIKWARGHGVLEEGGAEPVTRDTLFQASSISKGVTAVAALRTVEEGLLQLDQDVNDILTAWQVPDEAGRPAEGVTLRRLLSHTAGLNDKGLIGYLRGEEIPTLREMLDGASPAHNPPWRVQDEPGSIWRYSNGGYIVVTQILEDVTGRPFVEIAQEAVFEPVGMASSTYEHPLSTVYQRRAASAHGKWGQPIFGKWLTYPEMGPSGLWTTPTDLARLAVELMLARAGRFERVISREMADLMLTSQTEGVPYEPFTFTDPLYADWGLGWQLLKLGRASYFVHGGDDPQGFQSILLAAPDRGWGVVVMTNGANGGGLALEMLYTVAHAYGLVPSIRAVATAGYLAVLVVSSLLIWLVAYGIVRLVRVFARPKATIADPGTTRIRRARYLLVIPVTLLLTAFPYYIGLEVAIHSLPGFPVDSHIGPEVMGMMEQGELLARHGMIDEALRVYSELQETDPTLQIPASAWNVICWRGSLWGHADEVMEACELAVSIDPGNAAHADSRGLARALTGDYAGAAADFARYAEWLEGRRGYERECELRLAWIAGLEAGRNPFDEMTLAEMR